MSEDAFRYCEDLVRAHDKDRYLASLFAPAERRHFLFALYAFDLETARVKYLVHEPMAGTIRLQWWHDALGGLRAEEAAAHPVMTALLMASSQTGTTLAPLGDAVEARQAELSGEPPVAAAAAVFRVAAHMLGAQGISIIEAAPEAGRAVVLAGDAARHDEARRGYRAFRAKVAALPDKALPAFLPAALVPLRLRQSEPAQWRKQITLLRAAWFGFPRL